jgi:hypothetical protein
MQIVYRARSLADANRARDFLVNLGISAHVADENRWNVEGQLPSNEMIRVMVDNRRLDSARRALHNWKPA